MFLVASAACGDDDPTPEPTFQSFAPAATDPMFSEPRDAVPLDNGAVAFIARVNGGNALPDDAPEDGTLATVNDRYGVFVIDAPKGTPRIIQRDLVAPFNIASDGKDKLYVADLGGGASGTGAILQMSVTGGAVTTLAEGYQPQGVATDKDGKVFFTGKDKTSGEPGVFNIDGTPIVVGGLLRTPSGIDIADDGTMYVADPTAARDLGDEQVAGSGNAAIFKIVGTTLTVFSAGFEGGFPLGIALKPNGQLLVSAYKDRGAQSAVLIVDPGSPNKPTVVLDKLEDTFASAGLHRSRVTGMMAWSGGNTVYVLKP